MIPRTSFPEAVVFPFLDDLTILVSGFPYEEWLRSRRGVAITAVCTSAGSKAFSPIAKVSAEQAICYGHVSATACFPTIPVPCDPGPVVFETGWVRK